MKTGMVWVLLMFISCGRYTKKTVFHSFSDGFACSWNMYLYADGSFDNELCAAQGSGKYVYKNDTIFLSYAHKTAADSVFIIGKDGKLRSKNNWMDINYNALYK
jgi:hypothetical protein